MHEDGVALINVDAGRVYHYSARLPAEWAVRPSAPTRNRGLHVSATVQKLEYMFCRLLRIASTCETPPEAALQSK